MFKNRVKSNYKEILIVNFQNKANKMQINIKIMFQVKSGNINVLYGGSQ